MYRPLCKESQKIMGSLSASMQPSTEKTVRIHETGESMPNVQSFRMKRRIKYVQHLLIVMELQRENFGVRQDIT